jgi:hypothetical protein
LTPEEVNATWLKTNADELRDLAARVHLHHDWDASLLGLARMRGLLPTAALVREIGRGPLLNALRKARSDHPAVSLRAVDLPRLAAAVRGRDRDGGLNHFWDNSALADFRMTFPARVEIRLSNGTMQSNDVDIPRGGAGHPQRTPHAAAADKLTRWGGDLWSDVGSIDKAISEDAGDLYALLLS